MTLVKAWAAQRAGGPLEPFTYTLDAPDEEEVEVQVLHSGLCHTDLVFIDNEWGNIAFPFVPGHEIIGRITRLGSVAEEKGLSVGQTVGIGWYKESCLHCDPCLDADTHLCETVKGTIIGNHGGFATYV